MYLVSRLQWSGEVYPYKAIYGPSTRPIVLTMDFWYEFDIDVLYDFGARTDYIFGGLELLEYVNKITITL